MLRTQPRSRGLGNAAAITGSVWRSRCFGRRQFRKQEHANAELKEQIGNGDAKQKANAAAKNLNGMHLDSQTAQHESQHRTRNQPNNKAADGGENPKKSPRL